MYNICLKYYIEEVVRENNIDYFLIKKKRSFGNGI